MLLQQAVVALVGGLALRVASSPLSHDDKLKARELPPTHRLHERHMPHWREQWSKRTKVPDTAVLPVRIGLKQSNLREGHDKLMDMYGINSGLNMQSLG